MRWSIKNGLDGVVTDDPKRYLEICDEWAAGKRDVGLNWKDLGGSFCISLFALIFGNFLIKRNARVASDRPKQSKQRTPVAPMTS